MEYTLMCITIINTLIDWMDKYLLLFVVFILYACERHEDVKTLSETEYYFDERLSSISMGVNGSFWVGSETGDLFCFKDNYRCSFDLKEDKIYKVISDLNENGDTILWVGVRNSGIQKWLIEKEKDPRKIQTYHIDTKEDKFSPYDLLMIGSRIYAATSQGLFYVDKHWDANRLTLIYSSEEYLSRQKNNTFVVHNLLGYNDRFILCSTQSGVLVYDIDDNSIRFLLPTDHVQHVSVYNDTIFMVTNDHLYLSDFDGTIMKRINAGNSPRIYSQIRKVHCLIGTDEIIFSKNLNEFVKVPLRRFVPMYCRNIVVSDTVKNFTYLLTENAVWRIPNGIDIFKSSKSIKLACFAEGKIYFLSIENELYVQDEQSHEAKWMCTFSKDHIINWMEVAGKELYFCDVDNVFQKIDLPDSWAKNVFRPAAEEIYVSKGRINSVNMIKTGDETLSLLGTQSGLLSVDRQGKMDTVPGLSGMYITAIFRHELSGRIYVATLNNGVYYILPGNEIKRVAGTEKQYFVTDIIATNDHNANLIMLTNQQIISQNPADSVRAKGYQKLLYLNDTTFYALPQFGIHKFTISNGKICDNGIIFNNIRFTPKACFSTKENMVLGSAIGILNLPVDSDRSPVWTNFEPAFNIDVLYIVLVVAFVVFIAAIVLTIIMKRQSVIEIHVRKQKEDLKNYIEDLLSYSIVFEEKEKDELKQLQALITNVDVRTKEVKAVKEEMDRCSLRLVQLNREIGLRIPDKLSLQMDELTQMENVEAEALLKEAEAALATKDTQKINDQIKKNALWIGQRTTFISDVEELLKQVDEWVEIEHINKGIHHRIEKIRNGINFRPLADSMNEFDTVNKQIENINSPIWTTGIKQYMDSLSVYLRRKEAGNKDFAFLTEQLNEVIAKSTHDKNMQTLKSLKSIQDQVCVLRNLDEIKDNAGLYMERYNATIAQNNSLVNKKFDKNLANLIAESTKSTVRTIHLLIDALYEKLLVTDKHIIYDVLKLNNLDGQHAKVLALLICNLKVKRILIPGMLGIYGNLNPVISKIINERIRINESLLRECTQKNKRKTVFIYLLLQLLE